tara:strand:- start:21619 stop:22350 length:732 start_codon:yes stop_codon:yes gene_type:complete
MKRLLIISDNINICSRIDKILELKDNIVTTFAISSFTNLDSFKNVLVKKVLKYDLRKSEDIEIIIKSYDLVFSVHCKQLFPKKMIKNIRCYNLHPGYNPINRGWYPQVFAIINNLQVGATIHEINEDLDGGAIIARRFVEKKSSDTSLDLYNRIVDTEIDLFEKHIESIINLSYVTTMPEGEGNLFLKKDYVEICKLNLEQKLTLGDAIDKLRALTHGSFNNAFFINEKGKKVYVKIKLTTVE